MAHEPRSRSLISKGQDPLRPGTESSVSLENLSLSYLPVLRNRLRPAAQTSTLQITAQAHPLPILVKTPPARKDIYRVLPEGHAGHHSFTSALCQVFFPRALESLGVFPEAP